MADVATVAEENIVGVHVVKSFAQEHARAGEVRARARRRSSGRACEANRQRALYVPLLSFLPLLAQAAVLLVGGRMVVDGTLDARRVLLVQRPRADARHAAAHARHVDRPGAARDRVRRADLRDHRRARGGRGPPGRGRAAGRARASRVRGRRLRVRARAARARTTSTSSSSRADRRADRPHGLGQDDARVARAALLRRDRAGASSSTASTCAT